MESLEVLFIDYKKKWKKNEKLAQPLWVNPSKRGGTDGISEGWQGCSDGFPEENPVLPDSFTQIYILVAIGFSTF